MTVVLQMNWSNESGLSFVEVMVAVVLLGLIAVFSYAGIQTGLETSRRGKEKVEAVSVLQSVTEELMSSNLEAYVGRGMMAYSDESVPDKYAVKYGVEDTSYGVYRLSVEVSRGGTVIASNSALVLKQE